MKPERPKLMVSAYACEPGKGSEIGVGWHWVLELSAAFDLWVITRANNRTPIESWMQSHPEYYGIRFVYFDLPEAVLRHKKGRKGVHRYYLAWTRGSDAVIRATMEENGIPNFMHLTYGNMLWPVSDFGSRANFIWGPAGGLETIRREYSSRYHLRDRLVESARRLVAAVAPLTPGFRRRCCRASLILCKTDITRKAIPASFRHKAVTFTDVAADISQPVVASQPSGHEGLYLLCVGRLDAWRGFDLAVEAVRKLVDRGMDCRLTILGKGPDKARLRSLIAGMRLAERVTLAGEVPPDVYRAYMADADIVLNPSLKEGAVTLSYDAMSFGKPLVALDTAGYTRNCLPAHSVIVPVGPRALTVDALADAIASLREEERRKVMGEEAVRRAAELSWSRHGEALRAVIGKVMIN